ncbi:hypothetical protein CYLTODRAFT_416673 [Cylindrobasidium torrendii FP15055 ss-10]|uniref:Replication factor A protein 3 n=1 Tax=Cylindrobasidium torrendii FP15055 ss-10 TaxID=1314674 RepID=A0A0D7BSW1_9AGAR|nr:hypothetical protein CYLTODRAFT_416673 [Cylindrobasidium torrendii FP15055 ss-10]
MTSPRVNGIIMQNHINSSVRLPCKILRMKDSMTAEVQTSDLQTVTVKFNSPGSMNMEDHLYCEVIGKVKDASTISLQNTLPMSLGQRTEPDWGVINKCIEISHDAKFHERLFCSPSDAS